MKNFFGGIHPPYRKELSASSEPIRAVAAKQVVIPLQQHIGALCTPCVCVGDHVARYQKIGDGEGLCVPVHASVSGTVVAIEPRPHTSGRDVPAVVIENDFLDTPAPLYPADEADPDAVLAAIREAGIVGMGGAAFPGNVKAISAMGNVDTLIANACECEPYITADDTLLRHHADQVLSGMEMLKRILKPARVVLAVEDNKREAIECVRACLREHPDITLSVLPTRYPQGAEKQLILALTGREVPAGKLPVSVGCAVFNVSTFAAIFRAVRFGIPLTERIVTVSGEAIPKPQNFTVRIGTPFSELIELAGCLDDKTERVIAGGPMMGFAQRDLNVPVIKATNSILCLFEDHNGAAENPVCLRCGKCVGVCPMHLQPLYMYRYEKVSDLKELDRLHLLDCIECGCCAFTCPGKLPLVEHFRRGKQKLREGKAK